MGYIKPKAVIMTMWRRGFLKHLEKGSGDRFLILICLVNIQYSGKGSNLFFKTEKKVVVKRVLYAN